jgi:CRISPR/Cas system CSM-associated protein Csm3 (group 7 of RAMP superfamily)
MHKRLLNNARLGIVLRPRGPILVKSGIETPDPTRPGMEFVRTRHPLHGDMVYLPGTSLKGAIRSHAERILHGLTVGVCDPLDGNDRCRKPKPISRGEPVTSAQVFRAQCATCRTFGSLQLSGRVSLLDGYPYSGGDDDDEAVRTVAATNETETRWQVGVDRKTGQAQGGALFDLEVVVKGAFHTEVRLHNFQLWQLGLVAAVLRDMDDGDVPIGFGKARGLGQVAVDLTSLRFDSVSRGSGRLLGTAELCREDERQDYDLHSEDAVDCPAGVSADATWRGTRFEAKGDALGELLGAVVDGPLASFVTTWQKRPARRARR